MARKFLISMLAAGLVMHLVAAPYTVVIDAGHGGKDAGAIGKSGLQEKNLNLDVSLRLASKIRTQYPEVQVLLTRSSDEFIPLQGRADFVNKHNANLFICIHTNAAEARSAHGTEVFVLGTERMEENLDVAMRENAVMKLEADYQTAYQGFDPSSVESYIMFELMQNRYMDQSLQFASLVQNEFTSTLHRADRGVRQAAFWVLLKSACPSVLVEMGFVSNADEEKYLASDRGKKEVADAIFHAFCNYYKPGTKVVESTDSAAVQEQETVEHIESVPLEAVKTVQPTDDQVKKEDKKGCWMVQIFISKTILPESDHNFKGLKGCTYRQSGEWYKYMTGYCATKEEAVALQNQLKTKFPDCFVTKIEE